MVLGSRSIAPSSMNHDGRHGATPKLSEPIALAAVSIRSGSTTSTPAASELLFSSGSGEEGSERFEVLDATVLREPRSRPRVGPGDQAGREPAAGRQHPDHRTAPELCPPSRAAERLSPDGFPSSCPTVASFSVTFDPLQRDERRNSRTSPRSGPMASSRSADSRATTPPASPSRRSRRDS